MRSIIAAVLILASLQSLDCLSGTSNSRLNYFDIDLLRYCAEGKTGNVMVSPASIKSTLAMLLEGAHGATAIEIQTALRLTPNKDDYRQLLSAFMKDLQINTTSVSVQNANGLFVSKKLQLKKQYKTMVKRLYFSQVGNLDFDDPRTSAAIINGWVSSKTKGLITNVIDQAHITPQTELLVANALYFKGIWRHEFSPKQTHVDCFFKDGVCKNVAMMELDAELNYAYVDNLRAHAVELPYEGNRYSMIVLVPQDRDAGVALIRDLPYIGLLEISKMLRPSDVILTMPRFTVEYSDNIVPVLKNMGISTLFSSSANLSGIFTDPSSSSQVNSVFHKVYMQVDEKGTLAAAATAGMVVPLINSFVNLKIDRPFLFFIWDNEKGVVLFEGKIEEPTEFVNIQNKFGNKGQDSVKPQPIPNFTSGPYSPSNPQQVSDQFQPIENVYHPGSSQPIQPTNQQIYGQPIQTTNQQTNGQPIQATNQQIFGQPIQTTNQQTNGQPIQATNQQIYGQPIQTISNQPAYSQPSQQTNQPIQPSNQPIYPTNQPITTQTFTEPTSSPPVTRNDENKSWFSRIFG